MPIAIDPCLSCKHDAVYGVPPDCPPVVRIVSGGGSYRYKSDNTGLPLCCDFFVVDVWMYHNSNLGADKKPNPVFIAVEPDDLPSSATCGGMAPTTPCDATTFAMHARLYRKWYDEDHLKPLGYWKWKGTWNGSSFGKDIVKGSYDYPLNGQPSMDPKIANTYRVAVSLTLRGTAQRVAVILKPAVG
ncbi:MAG: hypothetical protein HY744_11320 [Deltaproteobacteria bacterium]|nr:hypothetical protein [Deltaproteobacteria bacterium]